MAQPPAGASDPRSDTYREALELARSDRAEEVALLQRHLGDPAFLARLDSDEDYEGRAERLRVAGVVQALAGNRTPAAQLALLALTTSAPYARHPSRIDLLIRALRDQRPAPPEAVRFWDRHSQPDDGFSNVTVHTLIENGSAPAIALFERKIADPAHPEEDRYSWLVTDVLAHRNDVELLRSCRRLLSGPFDPPLRSLLIDVLFDYQPEAWFRPAAWIDPPDRASASIDALHELRAIGDQALRAESLTDSQRTRVRAVLDEIAARGA